jgi:ATP-binding cassette, subfamily B, bacterial
MSTPLTTGGLVAIRRIAGRFRPYRWRMLASLALIVISTGLGMIWPLLLPRVIDVALPQHRTGLLAELCIAMIAAGLLSSIILVGQSAVANSLGQEVVHELRADVYAKVQDMPLEILSGEPNSRIQALLASDIGGISDFVTFTAQGALAAVVNLMAACVVMLILNWPLALASLSLGTVLAVLNHRFMRKNVTLAAERQERVTEMLKTVAEDLAMPGVILGRTLGQCEAQRKKFLDISREIGFLTRRLRLAGSGARALIGMTLVCLPPAIYWMSGSLISGLSLGTVVVISTMQVRLSAPIQQLLGLNSQFQSSLVMFDRVFDYLDAGPRLPESQPAATEPADTQPTMSTVPAPTTGPVPLLRLREVGFRYPHTDRDAIGSVDLTIRAGTTVIAGSSGSGKSTLALLMSGLMAPTRGVIEFSGLPTRSVLQAGVTLLSQEGITFNASLRDNLLFASPSATDAELMAALTTASLDGLVRSLPQDLDAIVGERGYQLSGGERQRVALARVLLAPTPVLIADEATSALDIPTAERIYKSLRANASTEGLVIITHRIPELAADDQIVLLEGGRIVETGAHAQLVAKDGLYVNLLRNQASGPENGRLPAESVLPISLGVGDGN